jgi:hypothetical protein
MSSNGIKRPDTPGAPSLSTQYLVGWLLVATIVSADGIWLSIGNYSVNQDGVVLLLKGMGLVMCFAALLAGVARIPRYAQAAKSLRYREVAHTFTWLALLLCFVSSASVLSYLCVTVNAPVIDGTLVRFDTSIGFHWLIVYGWVHSHPAIQTILRLAYESGGVQLLAVPALVGLMGRREELSEFVLLVMLAGVLVLLISTPFPASSTFVHFGVSDPGTASTVSHFDLLREGTLREFDLRQMQGLVSMPSFHTVLAVLYVNALRNVPYLRIPSTVLNVVMIASTPTQGGHYLADVFAGLLLSALTIFALRRLLQQRTAKSFGAEASGGSSGGCYGTPEQWEISN